MSSAELVDGDPVDPDDAIWVEPIDWHNHTMPPESLYRYLDLKAHHLITEHEWDHITVVGDYDRLGHIAACEKADKLFNWHRPSASAMGNELVLRCYPGSDYVRHYALIISSYLAMRGEFQGQVRYRLPEEADCLKPITEITGDMSRYSAVITGWGLPRLAGPDWHRRDGYWFQDGILGGKPVLYIGFLHSIWGDVAGRVVDRFAQLGARRVVYLGKVGALRPEIEPNSVLASGTLSLLQGRKVTWEDFFAGQLAGQPDVRIGGHVSSPSILLEGRTWLAQHAGYDFVDPEIGPMGQAAARNGIPFGYLHIVSNNLARVYAADLSNERKASVLQQRAVLAKRIEQLLAARLAAQHD